MTNDALLILIFFVLIVGCDRGDERSSPEVDTSAAVTRPVETEKPPRELEPPPAPAISETEVSSIVDTWLAAQNEGDFDAYSALYATKFEGIKRVGARTYSYDRQGWLADRERMFKKTMAVSVADRTVSTAGPTAVARFEQTWASGDFEDVGPKQLVITDTPEGPRIVREEMLMSTVVASDNPESLYNPLQAAIFVEPSFVVLRLDADGVETQNLRVLRRSGEAIADVSDPTDALNALRDQSFVVRSDDGASVCETKVESLHVLARAYPHFGQVQYWDGELGEPRLSDDQVAQEIWELSEGPGHLVVGKLVEDCEEGAWAHAAETKPAIIASRPAKGAIQDRVVEAFRRLPGHATIQKAYEEFGEGDVWSADNTNVTTWGPEDAPTYAYVWAAEGDGCGGFIGEFWAVYEIGAKGELELLTDPKAPGEVELPRSAFKIGDEVFFLSSDAQIRRVGETLQRSAKATIPYFDCPC